MDEGQDEKSSRERYFPFAVSLQYVGLEFVRCSYDFLPIVVQAVILAA